MNRLMNIYYIQRLLIVGSALVILCLYLITAELWSGNHIQTKKTLNYMGYGTQTTHKRRNQTGTNTREVDTMYGPDKIYNRNMDIRIQKETSNLQTEDNLEHLDLDYLLFLVKQTFPKTGNLDFPEFNETFSHSIPLNRNTNDQRSKECHNHTWVIAPLKRVSVIIPFINEPWSTLLRTVVSILVKSPLQYIQEIILVDDQSTREYLSEPLQRVLHPFQQISLVRTPYKMGPAATRNYGSRFAKGNVFIFLDAHMEVNVGWLEPLLDAISKDHSRIIVPHLTTIDNNNLQITGVSLQHQNILTWALAANYGPFRKSIFMKYKITDPIPVASLLAATIAVDRNYYFKIGGLGEYFEGWGGEDVELAIKSWLCGGGVSKCRCSVVSHLFKSHPYKMSSNPWMNIAKMAEAWLDEYQPIVKCIRIGNSKLPDVIDKSVLQSTFDLKKNLNCKPFKWYIENVYPGLGVPEPNTTAIHSSVSNGDWLAVAEDNSTLVFAPHNIESSCNVAVVNDRIKCHHKCLTFKQNSDFVFETCRTDDKFQIWRYDHLQIRPKFNDSLCLVQSKEGKTSLLKCGSDQPSIEFNTHFVPGCIKKIDSVN